MEQKQMWKLEFLLDELKLKSKTMKETAAEQRKEDDMYVRGIGAGMEITCKRFDEAISRFEEILKAEYMIEDVNLTGGEEDEKQVI